MKYFLFFSSLFIVPLFAAQIGDVQYDLPKSKLGWKRVFYQDDSTIYYVPANKTLQNSKEFFSAYTSNLSASDINEFALRTMLQAQLGREAKVLIIERTPTSVLYEWGMDDMYGFLFSLNRIFFSDDGAALLMYQTSDHKKVDAEKGIWLDALRSARISHQES